MFRIVNARAITPYRIIENACITINDGKITSVSTGRQDDLGSDGEMIDAKGLWLAPGFIDIHTHGGGGFDFMDGSVDSFIGAATMHARHGTTSLLPTTVPCTMLELRKAIMAFKEAVGQETNGARILGMHLEGPYINPVQKGAIDERFIKYPELVEYREILNWIEPYKILIWTAAPELPGALEFGCFLRERGILVSAGHSDAVFSEAAAGFENGFRHATHLYSAMSTVRRIQAYRYAGLLEYAFLQDGMSVEIIADGCHLPPSLLQLTYKIKGPDRIALVTDSMRAAGMPEGRYSLGSTMDVIVEGGVALLADKSAFAGSVATADRLVRTMVKNADVPICDTIRMITATPARIIGVSNRKGSIAAGMDADLVIFNENIDILLTVVEGKIVYQYEKTN